MYTYTTIYWLGFHLIIEGYKERSCLFGNSRGLCEKRGVTEGTGNTVLI